MPIALSSKRQTYTPQVTAIIRQQPTNIVPRTECLATRKRNIKYVRELLTLSMDHLGKVAEPEAGEIHGGGVPSTEWQSRCTKYGVPSKGGTLTSLVDELEDPPARVYDWR